MKKEKVYINKIDKKILNNQSYCDVSEKEEIIINDLSVQDKLNKLFNTNGYVFNKEVKIITNNKTYNTKIAGKVGHNIITLDNDIINIKCIKDIIY